MLFPGRKRPFEVYFSGPGEVPPPHVAYTSDDRIVLDGEPKEHSTEELVFSVADKRWENEDFFRKLRDLNAKRLPFKYWPRDMESPDQLMAWWQETGQLTASFRLISWREPGKWVITTIEPPQIGVLGWTGPRPFGA